MNRGGQRTYSSFRKVSQARPLAPRRTAALTAAALAAIGGWFAQAASADTWDGGGARRQLDDRPQLARRHRTRLTGAAGLRGQHPTQSPTTTSPPAPPSAASTSPPAPAASRSAATPSSSPATSTTTPASPRPSTSPPSPFTFNGAHLHSRAGSCSTASRATSATRPAARCPSATSPSAPRHSRPTSAR